MAFHSVQRRQDGPAEVAGRLLAARQLHAQGSHLCETRSLAVVSSEAGVMSTEEMQAAGSRGLWRLSKALNAATGGPEVLMCIWQRG
jgi:hypothetical protein